MEIYFCDICSESVPQADLEQGRAVRRGERVICLSCESSMSLAEAQAAAARGTAAPVHPAKPPGTPGATAAPKTVGRGALFSAHLIALAACGIAGYVGFHFTQKVDDLGGQVASLETLRDADATRIFDLQKKADAEALERARLEGELASRTQEIESGLGDTARELSESNERASAEVASLARSLEGLRGEVERASDTSERSFLDVMDGVTRIQEDLRYHADRLGELEVALAEGRLAAGPAGGGGGAGAGAQPAWQDLVEDLKNPNPGIRWEAVDALGQTRDAGVVPHLLPMLKDVDLFVRMATARVLGDLDAMTAVGALIDALEDTEAAMREAAVVSLRSITTKNFKFDPLAKEGERAKKVKAWRDWWKKEQPAEPRDQGA